MPKSGQNSLKNNFDTQIIYEGNVNEILTRRFFGHGIFLIPMQKLKCDMSCNSLGRLACFD